MRLTQKIKLEEKQLTLYATWNFVPYSTPIFSTFCPCTLTTRTRVSRCRVGFGWCLLEWSGTKPIGEEKSLGNVNPSRCSRQLVCLVPESRIICVGLYPPTKYVYIGIIEITQKRAKNGDKNDLNKRKTNFKMELTVSVDKEMKQTQQQQ